MIFGRSEAYSKTKLEFPCKKWYMYELCMPEQTRMILLVVVPHVIPPVTFLITAHCSGELLKTHGKYTFEVL
jgi:hypothetical protein